MSWIITPLVAGPLATNSFDFTIEGLSASTKYIYRSYFIVDGVSYYGNTLTGTTVPTPLFSPTLTTGIAGGITQNEFLISGNEVDDKGGALITEYGVLYTQSGSYGTDSNLIYSNIPFVSSASTHADIAIDTPYFFTAIGLVPNTTTYYRAFAKNAIGIGYGEVKNVITEDIAPSNTVNVFDSVGGYGINYVDADVMACGQLNSPIIMNQYYTAHLNWSMSKPTTPDITYPISVCILLNDVCIDGCMYDGGTAVSCSGSFVDVDVYDGDTLSLITCAKGRISPSISSTARIYINSITDGVGGWSKGLDDTLIAASYNPLSVED